MSRCAANGAVVSCEGENANDDDIGSCAASRVPRERSRTDLLDRRLAAQERELALAPLRLARLGGLDGRPLARAVAHVVERAEQHIEQRNDQDRAERDEEEDVVQEHARAERGRVEQRGERLGHQVRARRHAHARLDIRATIGVVCEPLFQPVAPPLVALARLARARRVGRREVDRAARLAVVLLQRRVPHEAAR